MKTRPFPRGFYAPEPLEARIAPATFTVTNLFGDNADGSLRKAINDANASPGADTIAFKLADPLLPHTITLDFANGEILIKGPLTIKGPGIDLLTVSGADMMRIFNIDDGVPATLSPTTISGLTLTDGRVATIGGAIYSAEPLALKNVVVRSSESGQDGGGIFVFTPGKVSIVNSRIVHNVANGIGSNCGGLYLRADAGISVVKTTIADNRADFVGGLHASATGAKSVILIDACTISGNTAGASGGGLQVVGAADGKIILKNSFITGNTADDAGGGLYFVDGNLTITKPLSQTIRLTPVAASRASPENPSRYPGPVSSAIVPPVPPAWAAARSSSMVPIPSSRSPAPFLRETPPPWTEAPSSTPRPSP